MKRIFDPKTMTYAFADGSGLLTHELLIRRNLLRIKAITDGIEGKRNFEEEIIEVNKLIEDYKKLNTPTTNKQ